MEKALRFVRIALLISTLLVVLLFCWHTVDIYLTGNLPENFSAPGVRIHPVWSREIVGEHLSSMLPVLIPYLILLAAGLLLQTSSAAAAVRREPAALDRRELLQALQSRFAELPPSAQQWENRRLFAAGFWLGASAVFVILCGLYLFRRENFASLDLESTMGSLLLYLLPVLAAWFLVGLGCVLYQERCVKQEMEVLKALPKEPPAQRQPQQEQQQQQLQAAQPRLRSYAVQIVLAAVALLLIALGVSNGGAWDVLVKAINICTECIGLG